jgi:hypothetical protein
VENLAAAVSAIVVAVGVFDCDSTNKSLAAGNKELNQLMAYLQRTLGRFWVIPKMAVHFALAGVVLAFPYLPVLGAVTAFSLIIGVIAYNNYLLAGH